MMEQEKRQTLTMVIIILIAFWVRLIGISSRTIWYDEAFAILFSEKGLSAMLYGTLTATSAGAADIHPLGYYSLLWIWMRVFGQSLVTVRMLSVLAGTATVFVAYLIAFQLFNRRTAAMAALFVALAPFPIHYSQEIRMYSFLALWLMIATYAYLRGSTGKSWGWWALFSVSCALAQYTHNLAAFYLIPLAITPLIHRNRIALISTLLAGFGALLLYLPWLIRLPSQFTKISTAYWVERPGLAKLFTLLLTYVTNLPVPDPWLFPALFVTLVVIFTGLWQTFQTKNQRPAALWLLYLSFAPPILLFIVSQWVPVYLERALLPSGVIFCVWLAWTIFNTATPNIVRNALIGMLSFAAAIGLIQHVTYRDFPYVPYRESGISLRAKLAPEGPIIHSNKLSLLPFIYYDRTIPQLFIADPPGSRTDTLAEATREVLKLTAAPDIEAATRGANRFWFIIFERSIQESLAAGSKTHPHLEYLHQNFTQISAEPWGGLLIYQFEKKQ